VSNECPSTRCLDSSHDIKTFLKSEGITKVITTNRFGANIAHLIILNNWSSILLSLTGTELFTWWHYCTVTLLTDTKEHLCGLTDTFHAYRMCFYGIYNSRRAMTNKTHNNEIKSPFSLKQLHKDETHQKLSALALSWVVRIKRATWEVQCNALVPSWQRI